MSDFADQIAALSPEKRALLARRNPLSFAQERLWFLDQLVPGSAAYIIPSVVRLEGQLDAAALEQSLNAIVARHEVLRTTFPAIEGHPVQLVAPALRLPLPLVDLGGVPVPEREAEAERLIRAEARRPFDLARGPLLRALLLRLDDREHVLLLTLHHIVADGWSIDVLLRELTALYQAFSAREPARLPELPIQYADYAAWQRDWLDGDALAAQLAYWRAQLDGAPSVLALPADHPRSAVQTFRGATHTFMLPAELSAALRALSQRAGATLFMTLLAAFQALLARYSGQDDIVVGTPIANRTNDEVEGLIGCFVNTLVLRANLSDNPPFGELLRRVRATCLDAYAHQDLPFEQLVAALQPQRTLSHTPLFQVLFMLQHAPPAVATCADLTLRPVAVEPDTAEFDLVLMMRDAAPGIGGALKYRTDLFEAATIARLLGHFQALLAGVADDPTTRVADLPLLSEAERDQLLVEWNAPAFSLQPSAFSLQELFEAQATRTPDAVAIVFEATTDDRRPTTDGADLAFSVRRSAFSVQMTYRELDRRANQLAHYLRSLGVGPDTLVGIYLERSLDLFVALLGTLKAGGAYLPLDPAYPPERIAFMLADARAAVLITTNDRRPTTIDQPTLSSLVVGRSSLLEVDLARDWPAIARQPATNPGGTVDGDNLAYVIYTSGSTGRPKGAMIVQRALVNYVGAMAEHYGLGASQRVLHFFSVSFDAAAEDIFPPLLSGATVVCPRDPTVWAPSELLDFCDRQRIDILHLPAAYWHALVAWLPDRPDAVPGSLRFVSAGGERIIVDALRRWAARTGPRVQFRNVYGPTETTITSIVYTPASHDELLAARAQVPIGRPIANTTIYLLDRQLQPVPIGVVGELYIGGVGLARGYHNRPELTAEKFIPNPFGTMNDERRTMNEATLASSFIVHRSSFGSRLYRTGDLARYLPDGTIEFLGRIDHQIKIRGYRIEPGEIEAVLLEHPEVREVVVVARGETADMRLVAYIVTSDELQVTSAADSSLVTHNSSLAAELRTFLAERLPEYMIPAAFVLLDALPLSPNGKLNLRALPEPDSARPAPTAIYVAPQTHLELRIAAIWQAVLGLDRVGVHDNFFALGGHSLLLIQMHSLLREALDRDLSMVELFQYPTIRSLAQHLYEGPAESPKRPHGQDRAGTRLDTMNQQRRFRQQSRSGKKPPR